MNLLIILFTICITRTQSIKIEKIYEEERPLKQSVFNYNGDKNGTLILGIFLLIIGLIADIILFLLIIDLVYRKRITEDDLKNFKNKQLIDQKVKTN